MGLADLRTVKQLAAESQIFTEPSLRWLIFNSRTNGLEYALVRSGRRVFIDIRRFEEWLESGGQVTSVGTLPGGHGGDT